MRRRTLIALGAASVIGVVGVVILRPQQGSTPPAEPPIDVTRGNVVVSVTGVGKVVEARSSLYTASGARGGGAGGGAGGSSSSQGSSAGTPAPAGAIYPGASGDLVKYMVTVGRSVRIGQPLASLDDHGVANAAAKQAANDLATAQVELRQKRTSDPARGIPPTRAERAAARLAVASARARLAQLLSSPRPAELSQARADVNKAQAELEALVGGTPESIARDRSVARHSVDLAQQRLDRVLAPQSQAEIGAARADLAKAEAEVDALKNPALPAPAALAAARQAVTAAAARLSAAQASGVAADIAAAQAELDRANADLAALTQPPPLPRPAVLAAAEQAAAAARQKLQQLLAAPNPADVTAARLELERARADLATLEAGPKPAALAAARQAVRAAQRKLAQLTGPPLPAEVKLARSDLGRAQAELSVLAGRGGPGSPGDVELAGLRVKAARIRLSTALTARGLLTVRSGSDGRVTSLLSAPGSPVDPLTPIVAVENLSKLAVRVDMSEFDIASVKPEMRAVVTVDALGGKALAGGVTFAAPTGNDSGGVVTFPVHVAVNRAGGLKPGMTANVRIIVAQRKQVIRVPLDAVTEDSKGDSIVTVVEQGGKHTTRKVELGLANDTDVEIVTGLREGEQIAGPKPEPSQGKAP